MRNPQGDIVQQLKLDKEENPSHPAIEVVNYPVKETDSVKFDHKFPTKFNFLTVAQWGPRKNSRGYRRVGLWNNLKTTKMLV